MEPRTGYAILDGQRIAYQVIGDGPVDLVVAPSWFSAVDIEREEPLLRSFLDRPHASHEHLTDHGVRKVEAPGGRARVGG